MLLDCMSRAIHMPVRSSRIDYATTGQGKNEPSRFLPRPLRASASYHAMANFKVQGRNRHVRGASNIKSTASVSANGLQKCWCEGFRVPCRQVRVVLTRRYHANQVRTRGNVINFFIEASAIKY